jgi:hypothetical protein
MTALQDMVSIARPLVEFEMVPAAISALGLGLMCLGRDARAKLADFDTRSMAAGIFLLWVVLIPYAIVWAVVDDPRYYGSWWAISPNYAALIVWPLVACWFVRRMGNEWPYAIAYVAFNVPGWLLTWFVTVLSVSRQAI